MACTVASALVVLILGLSFLHAASNSHGSGSSEVGFSVQLIHRDSPESPFHDPASIPFSSRQASFDISPSITLYKNSYLLNLGIGTPQPTPIYAYFDTGSQLSWVLCSPCKECYKHVGELFNPKKSTSYKRFKCLSNACNLIEHKRCEHEKTCNYRFTYADNSLTEGLLSTETLWFESLKTRNNISVPGITFGCTHYTKGDFSEGSVGLVSLSGHKLSLISQLGSAIENKFSYCLPSNKSLSTRVFFGTAAVVSGPGAVSTPFQLSKPNSMYNLILEDIHVNDHTKRSFIINLEKTASSRSKLMLIDTGTQITYIDSGAMNVLTNILVRKIFPNLKVDVPKHLANDIDLCFDWKNPIEKPVITFVFSNNAKVDLVDPFIMLIKEKMLCLTIASSVHHKGLSIFGSFSQMNYRIGYDLGIKKITFLPNDC